MIRGSLIAIDWGSSQYRAYLLNENGDIIDKTESAEGVFSKKNASFEDVLYTSCQRWFKGNAGLPVIMSGMIGSQQGWVETAYLPCPISIDQLCERLVTIPDLYDNPLFVVPGIATSGLSAFKDVMRGEETQLFGLLSNSAFANAVVCLPGHTVSGH